MAAVLRTRLDKLEVEENSENGKAVMAGIGIGVKIVLFEIDIGDVVVESSAVMGKGRDLVLVYAAHVTDVLDLIDRGMLVV